MKPFILISFLILSINLYALKDNTDEIPFLPPSHEQVEIEREAALLLAHQFDSLSKTPDFIPREFEKSACIFIDDLISNNYLLAAGILIHVANNILIDPESESFFKSDMLGLMVSTAEMYLRGGAFPQAVNSLETADMLCKAIGKDAKDYYLRNTFNIASLLCHSNHFEEGSRLYMQLMDLLKEEDINKMSPPLINSWLYCALLLADYVEPNFFNDTIELYRSLQNQTTVSQVMFGLFCCRILTEHFENYEEAYKRYNQLQSVLPHLCHSLLLPEIIENEWKYNPDVYLSNLPYYKYALEDIIIANMNSFSTNATEFFWDRIAKKYQHAFGLGLNKFSDDEFYLIAPFLVSTTSKNLSVHSIRDFYNQVNESGKKDDMKRLAQIKDLKKKIGNTTDSLQRSNLQSRLEDLEWPLKIGYDLAAGFVKNNNLAVLAYHSLDPDECEVEIIEYPFLNEDGSEIAHYGAIIKSKVNHYDKNLGINSYVEKPKFIDLGPVLAWEMVYEGFGKKKSDREKAAQYNPEEMLSASRLIIPLAEKIVNFRRAYISTTGILNNINIGALPYGEEGNPLNDSVEIVKINASYELNKIKETKPSLKSAAVFSNINFNSSETDPLNSDNATETAGYRLNIEKGGNMKKFYSLPINEKDLTDAIRKSSKKVISFSGSKASEEAFKKLDGNAPELIHIDSHGFYIPEGSNAFLGKHTIESSRERALLTCGLPLAGANIAWSGEDVDEGKEDGILTAWEISCMDLSKCKLAVLSACETAQGDLDPINGVLGLQRALRLAGVQTMLLTLWPVDNDLTQEFVNSFYSLIPESKDFNDAFIKTQRIFRQRHPDPYLWAPFILIN